jgi:hypothetical protein
MDLKAFLLHQKFQSKYDVWLVINDKNTMHSRLLSPMAPVPY